MNNRTRVRRVFYNAVDRTERFIRVFQHFAKTRESEIDRELEARNIEIYSLNTIEDIRAIVCNVERGKIGFCDETVVEQQTRQSRNTFDHSKIRRDFFCCCCII